ncbi:hypothetical protein [Marinitoga litoralis]|uniref:hypothetical protein n=1 Tax=Marinitoga litoralis TaxID=570855 RepID=UPI001961D47E|nr:hypothetical protein [Marinitoga litoralis]MBM7560470.1 putative membrane protein [Marinitoga litoralis]
MDLKVAKYFVAFGMILTFIENLSLVGFIIQFIGIYLISEKINNKKLFYNFVIALFLFYTIISFLLPQSIISIFKEYAVGKNSFYSFDSMEYHIFTNIKDHFSIITLMFVIYIISLLFERIAYKQLYPETPNIEILYVLRLILIELIIIILSYILFAKWVLDGIGFMSFLSIIIVAINIIIIFLTKIFEIIVFLKL